MNNGYCARTLLLAGMIAASASCFTTKNVNLDGGGPGSGGRDGGVSNSGGSVGTGGDPGGGGGGTTGTGGSAAGSGGGLGTGGVPVGGTGGTAVGSGGRSGTGGGGGISGSGGVSGGAGRAGTGGAAGGAGRPGTGGSIATGGGVGTGGAGTGGAGGCRSSVSGTVWDPAGKLPIYNAIVYAPTTPLDPIPAGVSCDRCGTRPSGNPVATTLSDSTGRFRLEGIPAGSNIPMVIQVGKWRRPVTIPVVAACADTPITDVNLTRLPRTQAEGNIPKIAVMTGGADALECLLRRIGIADSEFTTDIGTGRVHLYAGGNGTATFSTAGAFSPATTLWASAAKLATYDMLVMSCEGSSFREQKPQTSIDNVAAYAGAGGRLLLGHLHFYWLQQAPAFSGTATYIGNLDPPPAGSVLTINQTFPKGLAFAGWLAAPTVGASTTLGQLSVNGSEHSVTAVNAPTAEWMFLPNNPNDPSNRRSVQHLGFSAPAGMPEAMQCGRVGFTDIHVKQSVVSGGVTGGGDVSDPDDPFPTGCKTNDMSPQQKAMEFLFFDLGSCIQSDAAQPVPP